MMMAGLPPVFRLVNLNNDDYAHIYDFVYDYVYDELGVTSKKEQLVFLR